MLNEYKESRRQSRGEGEIAKQGKISSSGVPRLLAGIVSKCLQHNHENIVLTLISFSFASSSLESLRIFNWQSSNSLARVSFAVYMEKKKTTVLTQK